MSDQRPPITRYLRDWKEGDPASAGRVVAELYSELHRMAARVIRSERAGHTLQPTALINEVYLRLGGRNLPECRDRAHFFAVVATTLRRIVIDHARAHRAGRRGGAKRISRWTRLCPAPPVPMTTCS